MLVPETTSPVTIIGAFAAGLVAMLCTWMLAAMLLFKFVDDFSTWLLNADSKVGQTILLNRFKAIADIGVGRDRLRLGVRSSAAQQGGKNKGDA